MYTMYTYTHSHSHTHAYTHALSLGVRARVCAGGARRFAIASKRRLYIVRYIYDGAACVK